MSSFDASTVTRAVRASIATDREHGAVVPPLHLSSNFAFESFAKPRTYDYTRSGNPTRSQLASAIADLEGGEHAVVTSTGMSAVTLVLQLLNPSDTLLIAHDCYGGTQRLVRNLARRGVLNAEFIDLTSAGAIDRIRDVKPKLVWIETPSNPLLRITDIQRVAAAAHATGALVIVDNTFLSPALQQPIALGADIVVHSTTKYLNGHSDVVGGAVVARDRALGEELGWWANCLGITGAPFDSYLTLRGIRTLHSRLRDHLENTEAIVDALCRHPAVKKVYYPGLGDHPGHEIARRQQRGFGAMVSFEVHGGTDAAAELTSRLNLFTLAESLGGVESLVAHPATMTHASMDAETRAAAGISASLLRLSVGIESAKDLVRDLTDALDHTERQFGSATRRESGVTVVDRDEPADVILLGFGSIARELASQLTSTDSNAGGVRIAGLVDRSGYILSPGGFAPERLREIGIRKAGGHPLGELLEGHAGAPLQAISTFVRSRPSRPILVDATAADTTDILAFAINAGVDVVLANKLPLAAAQQDVDQLLRLASRTGSRLRYEATVGAGLPVLDTIHKLLESGDEIRSIEGCPSGTLGFLFGELGTGVPFSRALGAAIERGYTEPDPRADLSGIDVARKALILGRAIGFRGELADIRVESLVPGDFSFETVDEFLARVPSFDDRWASRVQAERAAGRVLRYRARVTRESITVGLVSVPVTDSLGTLIGTDNQFTFRTARYHEQPLVITGPGAGPSVTAAGVLNDVLSLARTARVVSARASYLGETARVKG